MTATDRVVLLGDLMVDVVMPVQYYPHPGEDSLADGAYIRVGGGVANTAGILAGLGVRPALIGRTGSDFLADFELGELERAGVDISAVRRDDQAATGLTFVPVIPSGERTLFGYRGANPLISPEDITPDLFRGASHLHVSGYAFMLSPQREAAWKAVGLARQAGIPISLDTGMEPIIRAADEIRGLLAATQVAVLGVTEVRALFGTSGPDACADALLAQGIQLAAVKLGARGCLLAKPGERVALPAFPVDTVDATGAGDAFSAGLIYARLGGLSLAAAGVLANALGALVTTVWGGGCGLIQTGRIAAFLEKQLASGRTDALNRPIQEILASLAGRPGWQLPADPR